MLMSDAVFMFKIACWELVPTGWFYKILSFMIYLLIILSLTLMYCFWSLTTMG